ncbi:hypothetical protein IJN73_00725 [Candidatus Saccharibacteria bacterium]|nr:hypothetical protein [Candidatus Saccharibacteria bacterium]
MDNSLEKSSTPEETPKNAVRRKNRRPLIFAIALVLIAGIVVFIFVLNNKNNNTGSSSDTSSTSETKEDEEDSKPAEKTEEKKVESITEPDSTPEETVQNKAPVQQEGTDPNTLNELTGVINYASVNDDTLMIRVSIDQYLSSGTCFLELTSANDSFSLSDNIMPSASTSSCGYDIATSLLVSGRYEIKITINSENKTGIIKGEVDV